MELPLQQHPTFGAALNRLGRDVRHVDLPGAAPLQIIRRFGLTFAARGPVWSDKPDPHALRHTGPIILNADHAGSLRTARYRMIMTPASVAEIDLRCAHSPHPKWRTSLRKTNAANLSIRIERFSAKHQWLLDADLAQQNKKRYRALPHPLIHAFAAENPDHVTVFTALKKHEAIGAMLFLSHRPVTTYHIGWSNAVGRKHCAHHLLLNQAIARFAHQGFTRLDLGIVDTENAPGLARFKIGSGAKVRTLGGTWLRCPI